MAGTACIVQARMGSTRLPGKVMKPLGGAPVLTHVLSRCAGIPGVDVVVCATVEGPEGDPIERVARAAGAEVFRGSERDVLGRYHGAAHMVDADTVMRITSDCPLMDPQVSGEVLAALKAQGADYACNSFQRTYPLGIDCECFTIRAMDEAAAAASDAFDREHVTPWIKRNEAYRRINLEGPGGIPATWRWILDWPEDYAFLKALFAYLPSLPAMPSWTRVRDIVLAHKELQHINAVRAQAA